MTPQFHSDRIAADMQERLILGFTFSATNFPADVAVLFAAVTFQYHQALRRCHKPLHYPVSGGFHLYMKQSPNNMRRQ
jgi:hypothetical protein